MKLVNREVFTKNFLVNIHIHIKYSGIAIYAVIMTLAYLLIFSASSYIAFTCMVHQKFPCTVPSMTNI